MACIHVPIHYKNKVSSAACLLKCSLKIVASGPCFVLLQPLSLTELFGGGGGESKNKEDQDIHSRGFGAGKRPQIQSLPSLGRAGKVSCLKP